MMLPAFDDSPALEKQMRVRRTQRRLRVIDAHCGGEPARVVVSGLPSLPSGLSVAAQRDVFMAKHDDLRTLLITEPRGYPCQNVNYIVAASPGSKAVHGFVIAEQGEPGIYPLMSGHNAVCVATVLLETGMVPMNAVDGEATTFTLEAPVGDVEFSAICVGGKARSVKLVNQPAFVLPTRGLQLVVDVPTLGPVNLDIAFGGMWYAIVDAASVGLELLPANGKEICRVGEMVKVAAREQLPVEHPSTSYQGPDILVFRDALSEVDDLVVASETNESGSRSSRTGRTFRARNAVVMSNGRLDWERPSTWTGMIDRSPCGTGTCAVMAALWARGEMSIGDTLIHDSIVGSTFIGKIESAATVIGADGVAILAVVPSIEGSAWITQYCDVVVDPTDPFPSGYTVADIWSG